MDLDLQVPFPPVQQPDNEPVEGDLYRSKHDTLWLVVGVDNGTALYLTYDNAGILRGTGRVGCHVLRDRRKVGRVTNMPAHLETEWF